MKFVLDFTFAILFALPALAALPPARFIAAELVKNSGSGVYQIEQDVQFTTSGEPLVLRETWWVGPDNSMRLEVRALRELKDQFKLSFVYQGGQRTGISTSGRTSKKITPDFIEQYFHIRSTDRLMNELVSMRILSPASLNKRPFRIGKEVDVKPEPQVRLARTGGGITYAFGTPSPEEGEPNSGFWIEQDVFVLRKFRLPSGVEVSSEKFTQSPHGLLFPRLRTVRWGTASVQIQTVSVASKSGLKSDFFQPPSLQVVNRTEGIQNPALKTAVEEFYQRYR